MGDPIPERPAPLMDGQVDPPEMSKNALKKAAKQEKLAAEKAQKAATSTTIEVAKTAAAKPTSKAAKTKADGKDLISIDVRKEDDFPGWYQQVLTKGEMLDYYDVSGCYILKVRHDPRVSASIVDGNSLRHISSGRRFRHGLIRRSRASTWITAPSPYLSPRMSSSGRRPISRGLQQRWHGSHTREYGTVTDTRLLTFVLVGTRRYKRRSPSAQPQKPSCILTTPNGFEVIEIFRSSSINGIP